MPELRPGGDRPTTLPGRPGIGDGNRPNFPNRPGNEDGNRPGVLPERPGVLPNRPGIGDGNRPNRPGIGDGNRPNRPDDNRPNFGDRNNNWYNNNVINNKPKWANINNSTNINIHNRWNNSFNNPRNPGWWNRPDDRMAYWGRWGGGVRSNWGNAYRRGYFNGYWWGRHSHGLCGWHYHYWNHNRDWDYWWTIPTFAAVNNFFAWSAPQEVWSQPVYYDYGSSGNVVYQDNSVYVGGTQVATAEEYAMSAMDLATVEPPATQEEAENTEWMPLGTFAVSSDEQDTDPTRVIQLAVNKEGIIAGTLYNTKTDQSDAVQGQVDKETQRVAFRIGESESIVVETGLYNLTQDEAAALVHFGPDRQETWLLVRLEAEEGAGTESSAGY